MKKVIALVAVALLVASVAACYSGQRRAPATTTPTYQAPGTTYTPSMPAPSGTAPAGTPSKGSCGAACGGPAGCG